MAAGLVEYQVLGFGVAWTRRGGRKRVVDVGVADPLATPPAGPRPANSRWRAGRRWCGRRCRGRGYRPRPRRSEQTGDPQLRGRLDHLRARDRGGRCPSGLGRRRNRSERRAGRSGGAGGDGGRRPLGDREAGGLGAAPRQPGHGPPWRRPNRSRTDPVPTADGRRRPAHPRRDSSSSGSSQSSRDRRWRGRWRGAGSATRSRRRPEPRGPGSMPAPAPDVGGSAAGPPPSHPGPLRRRREDGRSGW